MDSGNSGSMQSSSGGDEEYDSRADSISAFFNTPGGLASLSHQYHTRVPSTSLHHNPPAANAASTSSPPLFDPFYVYFDGLARSPPTLTSGSSPLCSLDMPWPPRGIGPSNPSSCTDVAGLMASAPPPRNTTGTAVSFPMGAGRDLYSGGVGPLPSSSLPPLQQQPSSAPPHQNPATAAVGAATAAPPRSSKKRSRASRRASTTVLTTDTSNFRAMVQEFTGLPAPPFSSSPFPRARFDLLHAAASSVMRSSAMSDASPHHYLLRPFAQQLPVLSSSPFSLGSSSAPSFAHSAIPGSVSSTENVATTLVNATTSVAATASASLTGAIANTNTTSVTTASAAISTNTASTASYQQLPSDHLGLQSQHQSLPSMFDYTSLAQSFPSTKYSSASVPPMVCSKKASPAETPMGATTADYSTVASGFRHGHADARLATTQSSTEPAPGMTSSRGGGSGSGSGEAAGDDLLRWVGGPASGSDRGDQFRPAGGSCSGSQRGSNCKLNYGGTTSSSDYHAEKGAENGSSTRGEGMVESWICSSD